MGAVKQHFHDDICALAEGFDDYDYDMHIEAQRADGAYLDLINALPDAYHRTAEQQRQIDQALSVKLQTSYAVRHHG